MKKDYIFNTILGILAAAKAIDANANVANKNISSNSEPLFPAFNDHTVLNFNRIESPNEQMVALGQDTSSLYTNLDIEIPVSQEVERTMRSNIRGRLIKLARNLDDNFPTKKKYVFNSGNPVGLIVLNPSEFDVSMLTRFICQGERGTDLSLIRKNYLATAIDIINEAMQSEGIPLKLSQKPFTQPEDFNNPFNKEITQDQLMKPRELASPMDMVWGSQALLINVECNNIFGHPDALAETGDRYSFKEDEHLREELAFKVSFFKRFIGTIGPGTIIHEIFHNIIKGHPHELMDFDPTNPYDMAILRTMCKPTGRLGSSMMYADECKKLPEFSRDDYFNYWHNPKISQVGIMELFAAKAKLNPNGLHKHLQEAEDLLYQEAKIQYQLVMAAQKEMFAELEHIMKKDSEMSSTYEAPTGVPANPTLDASSKYVTIGIIAFTAMLAYKLIPAILGYKQLREAQHNIAETTELSSTPSPVQSEQITSNRSHDVEQPGRQTATIGMILGQVGNLLAQDIREQFQSIEIKTPKREKSVSWQRADNWEEEIYKISELIRNKKIEPEEAEEGHRFSLDNEDLFLTINKKGIMYGVRYDGTSQYPHVYAVSPPLQVNAPPPGYLNPGDIMNFLVSSQWEQHPNSAIEAARIDARIQNHDIHPQQLIFPKKQRDLNGTYIKRDAQNIFMARYDGARFRFPQVYLVPPDLQSKMPQSLSAGDMITAHISKTQMLLQTAKKKFSRG